jgi:hypothetical protein
MFSGGPSEALIQDLRRERPCIVRKLKLVYSWEVTSQLVTHRWIVFCATITGTHSHCGCEGRGGKKRMRWPKLWSGGWRALRKEREWLGGY